MKLNFFGSALNMIPWFTSALPSARQRHQIPLQGFTRSNTRADVNILDGKLFITTAPQRFAYAAMVDLERLGLRKAVSIQIVARTTGGIASFGITDQAGTAFLVEKQLHTGNDFSAVDLYIHSGKKAGRLVVRSFADDGTASVVEIQEVIYEEHEELRFEQLYAVAGTIHSSRPRRIRLEVRSYKVAIDHEGPATERDGWYEYEANEFDLSETALFLIDPWARHPNSGVHRRVADNIRTNIVPLLGVARTHQLLTIYLPHAHQISTAVAPRPGEVVIFGGEDYEAYEQTYNQQLCGLLDFLADRNVRTLIYAGYATNRCLLHRPAGILQMAQRGYKCIILRDCTVAIETPQTLEGEWIKFAMINMVEDQYGGSTTLDDLRRALEE
jgi:nicotinamidase-related amidase